jgi:hypothetical protein
MADSPKNAPELSSRLRKTNEELRNLQNSVKTGMIDIKVLTDFRTDRASSPGKRGGTTMAGCTWKGGDPYKLMEQVAKQRVEMATRLIKDLTVDLESLDVDIDTPDLPALNEAVCKLAVRLRTLFPQ